MAFYDSIKLEKGMYNQGLTKALESIDPSEAYEGTELSGLDAYERQLKRFNIKVKGQNSDVLDCFFKSTDSAVLFPEFVKRSVLQGMESCSALRSVIATVTDVDNNDYRTIKSTTDASANDAINEASDLPKTIIQTKSNLVAMKKRGRVIASSYEALRHKRLDLFAVMLKRIGADIARAQLGDAVDVLLNGDESGNAAASIFAVSGSGIAYADLVELCTNFSAGEPDIILVNSKTMQKILVLEELKAPQTILSINGGCIASTPLGVKILTANSLPDGVLLVLDSKFALEMIRFMSGVVVDYDKLIDKGFERSAVTSTVGFAKIWADATKQMLCTLD